MLTEIDYCNYDTCVMLKELGFNQYATLRTYAGKGGVWLGELPNPEPDYKEGDLIALRHAYGIPRDGIEIAAPSLYEAQKWLREEKNIIVDVRYGAQYYNVVLNHRITCGRHIVMDKNNRIADFTEYEEALSEGIKEAVKILNEEEL